MAEAEGPEAWYRSLPVITRGYMTAAFATTVVTQLELVSPMLLYLDFDLVLGKLELWRILTNFCFFGTFSLPFVFSMFFLVRYGKELETKRFDGRPADFLWCLAITGIMLTAVAYVLGNQPFLASSMLSAVIAPFVTTPAAPAAPSAQPLMWGVLSWVRRELDDTFANFSISIASFLLPI